MRGGKVSEKRQGWTTDIWFKVLGYSWSVLFAWLSSSGEDNEIGIVYKINKSTCDIFNIIVMWANEVTLNFLIHIQLLIFYLLKLKSSDLSHIYYSLLTLSLSLIRFDFSESLKQNHHILSSPSPASSDLLPIHLTPDRIQSYQAANPKAKYQFILTMFDTDITPAPFTCYTDTGVPGMS